MSPSTCSVPRPMILSPWPMILRSLPMTDFSPLDGGVSDRLAGDWVFGSTEALRVNMKSPDDCYTPRQTSLSIPSYGCTPVTRTIVLVVCAIARPGRTGLLGDATVLFQHRQW